MMITPTSINDAKRVTKPWGYELWLEYSESNPYVMKILQIDAGKRLSLQVHSVKHETMLILEGEGFISTSKNKIDADLWLANRYSETETMLLFGSIRDIPIKAGSVITINPGEIHRITATTDLRLVECSTNHPKDVVRLQDDNNRQSGYLDSEHC